MGLSNNSRALNTIGVNRYAEYNHTLELKGIAHIYKFFEIYFATPGTKATALIVPESIGLFSLCSSNKSIYLPASCED